MKPKKFGALFNFAQYGGKNNSPVAAVRKNSGENQLVPAFHRK